MTNFTSDSRVGRVLLLPAGLLACSLFTPFTVTAKNDIPVTISQQVRTKIQVNGTVTDATGEPLIGATVLEKASGNGTITDVDGNFSLAVPSDAVLSVSYIGYKPQNIVVNGKTTFNVVLEDDSEKLEEVVVVGYGVQRKVNLSGSVDQINAKQLEARPITNISKGLQGMVPNLNIDFTSGEPGQAAKINIRGEASINGGSPLILIDGVASDAEELNRLLPEDIETLSVLKDASWFHWTGITPAISQGAADACLEAIQAANKLGVPVSCDLNYRKNLWKYGKKASEVMPELVAGCDVILGNEEDAEKVFGIKPEGFDVAQTEGQVNAAEFESVCTQLMEKFPRAKKVIITLRGSINANHNTWGGVLYADGKLYQSRRYDITHIVDRVGGGDSFMGGLIYGLLTYTTDDQKALDFAVAASCLKHTIYGDFNQVTVDEVEKLMEGDGSGRVSR
jgi:sugar/nucleoside kinase (ribokinase family)